MCSGLELWSQASNKDGDEEEERCKVVMLSGSDFPQLDSKAEQKRLVKICRSVRAPGYLLFARPPSSQVTRIRRVKNTRMSDDLTQ